jgi:release factor glutamine methyltransferase
MTTIVDILKQAQILLNEPRSGEILLAHILKKSRAYLYTYPEKILTPEEIKLFETLIARRQQGEPIAYLVGEQEFYSLNFKVTRDTLIPRPETEMLVEEALKHIQDASCQILELGTGSGAIAVTLAQLKPNVHVIATDISNAALEIAKENALIHQVNNIEFILSDWFSNLKLKTFDMIISNPPYIAEYDHHLENLSYEPINALTSGAQGLDALNHIIALAPEYLKPNGCLLVEHGFDQKESVQTLFNNAKFKDIQTLSDLAGNPRITMGQKTC